MPSRYRCKRVINGVQCDTRVSLTKPLREYVRPPKCKVCKKQLSYKDNCSGPRNKRLKCNCGAIPYPHRSGTKTYVEGAGLAICSGFTGELSPEEIEDMWG